MGLECHSQGMDFVGKYNVACVLETWSVTERRTLKYKEVCQDREKQGDPFKAIAIIWANT